jgi:hypothetical protein
VRNAFGNSDSIILQYEDSMKLTKCKVVTYKRYDHTEEKHLTTGWYNFVRENRINKGDKLKFQVNTTSTVIRVKIIRGSTN